MCFPLDESTILNRGFHAGHEWVVVHNGIGYRCGYVKVEPGHPWHGKDYGDIECEVHGGLTFCEADKPCDKGGPDNGWWVGFDCAHGFDARDPSLPGTGIRNEMRMLSDLIDGMGGPRSVIRNQEYVEAECRSLCEQAAGVTV